jgi:hypothetical protein
MLKPMAAHSVKPIHGDGFGPQLQRTCGDLAAPPIFHKRPADRIAFAAATRDESLRGNGIGGYGEGASEEESVVQRSKEGMASAVIYRRCPGD